MKNKKWIIWITVMHCGLFWISYCPSRHYVAESGNITLLGNQPRLIAGQRNADVYTDTYNNWNALLFSFKAVFYAESKCDRFFFFFFFFFFTYIQSFNLSIELIIKNVTKYFTWSSFTCTWQTILQLHSNTYMMQHVKMGELNGWSQFFFYLIAFLQL